MATIGSIDTQVKCNRLGAGSCYLTLTAQDCRGRFESLRLQTTKLLWERKFFLQWYAFHCNSVTTRLQPVSQLAKRLPESVGDPDKSAAGRLVDWSGIARISAWTVSGSSDCCFGISAEL